MANAGNIETPHLAPIGKVDPRSWLAIGGLAAALGASSCCVLPLVFFTLGISGAWIGNLTALASYQPFFVGAALVLLALGLVRVYRRPPLPCADGDTCARPLPARGMKVVLWTSLALVLLAIAFPYIAPIFIPA